MPNENEGAPVPKSPPAAGADDVGAGLEAPEVPKLNDMALGWSDEAVARFAGMLGAALGLTGSVLSVWERDHC